MSSKKSKSRGSVTPVVPPTPGHHTPVPTSQLDLNLSVTDLYTIGIGPSSSHTVGPMRAAKRFVDYLASRALLETTNRVIVELFGSLALTGHGHGTDIAILAGLSGERPSLIDPEAIAPLVSRIRETHCLHLGGIRDIPFFEDQNLVFQKDQMLPEHSNGMRFHAYSKAGDLLVQKDYFSVGGGYVVSHDEGDRAETKGHNIRLPHPFTSAAELLAIGQDTGKSIADIMRANEACWRSDAETNDFLDRVSTAMINCIQRGCETSGILPGGLQVKRRAGSLYRELMDNPERASRDPLTVLDWVNLYALAVNEENAAGGRVVTAPTNGAAGVIPAVLKYYQRFCVGATMDGTRNFLLTAAAIGSIYKKRASISAAEVGCQGEVGVACSMAAGALTAVLGGTNEQVENAAEIGMEHNLGLTCDPIGGLVQIPCIERNTMGAMKAINAARLALAGDGTHVVSLDEVIETMRQTGEDMLSKYKETSQGGLAVNVVEC
ncbi:L-serine ammonia-lyase [Sneathiella chinensis]|uniref:L-serine ammonia-lyase n=1 Tax=Sneathiella chinensis TaxID=349750 RepID=A0ABQ5U8N1_9PROT|nr:L-serine ammonia-lyase [Sneathiella chinensis]GLQ06821.1 L-serine dehydratase [Sneathiella chinensis]